MEFVFGKIAPCTIKRWKFDLNRNEHWKFDLNRDEHWKFDLNRNEVVLEIVMVLFAGLLAYPSWPARLRADVYM